jgi:hypothetical protein
MADDRKQYKRHPPEVLRIRFEHPSGGERAEATAWDASLGGMFLETSVLLDEGALVALDIETAQAKVSVDARVLWKRAIAEGPDHPQGISVRFLDLTDEVKAALTNAIIGGGERTILGVGGATIDTTTPGVVGAKKDAEAPRQTQLGVAPPANLPETTLPGAGPLSPHVRATTEASSAPSTPEPSLALDLVTKKASEPKVPLAQLGDKSEREEDTKKRVARSEADSERPKKKSGGGGMFFFLLLLAGAGGAAYYYKDEIAKFIATPPAPTATVTAEPSASAPVDASTAMTPPSSSAAPLAGEADAGTRDASAARDGGANDGGTPDAGHKEAGAHAHDAGATHAHDAGKPAPKHSP